MSFIRIRDTKIRLRRPSMMIESGELEKDVVRDVKVPSEEVVEVRDGKKRTMTKKFLPGYILVEMDLPELGWKVAVFQD